jgi:hypothetical protein
MFSDPLHSERHAVNEHSCREDRVALARRIRIAQRGAAPCDVDIQRPHPVSKNSEHLAPEPGGQDGASHGIALIQRKQLVHLRQGRN